MLTRRKGDEKPNPEPSGRILTVGHGEAISPPERDHDFADAKVRLAAPLRQKCRRWKHGGRDLILPMHAPKAGKVGVVQGVRQDGSLTEATARVRREVGLTI